MKMKRKFASIILRSELALIGRIPPTGPSMRPVLDVMC